MKHLWETEHPYYCEESNYFVGYDKTVVEYGSWAEWWEANESYDIDLNLVFRWDWRAKDGEWGEKGWVSDRLTFNIMGQRKGLYRTDVIWVSRDDEAAVMAYLETVWAKIKDIWSPLGGERA